MLPNVDLRAALTTITVVPLDTYVYRAIHVERLFGYHAGVPYVPNPLHSLGAVQRGGRYTPRNSMATLYVSGDPGTALLEANQQSGYFPAGAPFPPTVQLCCRAVLTAVLDLVDPAVVRALGTTDAELRQPWRLLRDPPTHRLAT